MFWRLTFTAKALAVICGLPGCGSFMVDLMAHAPNHGRTFTPVDGATCLSRFAGASMQLAVPVGPPEATLAVWVFEPKMPVEPRATVLLLHGYQMRSLFMLNQIKWFRQAGYRIVAVDSRGHGGSSGDWTGYGGAESRDLVHVVDRLEREGLIPGGRLGVYGVSMGAATALQFAAIDRRVRAVVAVAPFTSYFEVAPGATRAFVPFPIPWWTDEKLKRWMHLADQKSIHDYRDANALAAAPNIAAPTLILHGANDRVVPLDHSRRLAEANPHHITRKVIENKGHFMTQFDLTGQIRRHTVEWFDQKLEETERRTDVETK